MALVWKQGHFDAAIAEIYKATAWNSSRCVIRHMPNAMRQAQNIPCRIA